MLTQDVEQVINALQSFAGLLEKDGLYNERHRQAFEEVVGLLDLEKGREQTTDLIPVSRAAARYLNQASATMDADGRYETNTLTRARASVEMSDVFYTLGDWDESLRRLSDALQTVRQNPDENVLADAYLRIGRVQSRRAVWDEAIRALEQARGIYQKLNAGDRLGQTMLMLANAEFLRGRYTSARDYLHRALSAGDQLPELIQGDIHLTWGVVEQVTGKRDAAIEHFSRCADIFSRHADPRRQSQPYFNLAILYMEQEDWKKAGQCYEKSLMLAQEGGDLSMVGMIYLRRAEMQAKLADTRLALRYARRAQNIFDRLKLLSARADVYRLYGEIAGMIGAGDEARLFLAESRRLQQAAENPLGEIEVAETEAALHEREGHSSEAAARFQYALTRVRNMGASGAQAQRVEEAIIRLTRGIEDDE